MTDRGKLMGDPETAGPIMTGCALAMVSSMTLTFLMSLLVIGVMLLRSS